MDDNAKQTIDDQAMPQAVPVQVAPVSASSTHAADKVAGGRIQTPVAEIQQADSPTTEPAKTDQPTGVITTPPAIEKPQLVASPEPPVAVQTQAAQPAAPSVTVQTGKEQEPQTVPLPDVAKMTESEIVQEEKAVESELEKLVEQSPMDKKMDLPKEIKNIGAALANEDSPMPDFASGVGVFPMTYDEALKTKKKSRIRESIKWLSTLIIYHWKKLRAKPEDTGGGSAFG
jgi:hypothetical protein